MFLKRKQIIMASSISGALLSLYIQGFVSLIDSFLKTGGIVPLIMTEISFRSGAFLSKLRFSIETDRSTLERSKRSE